MGYQCPFCGHTCFDDGRITKTYFLSHEHNSLIDMTEDESINDAMTLCISLCPNCEKSAIRMFPCSSKGEMHFSFSYPAPDVKFTPEYIPTAIRNDYIEAVSIVDLSPKASATLSRRCLQGMIRDFWGIREKNLNAEITALNGKIPITQWQAIDGLRKIGNIGAHMEKDVELIIDVDSDEAKKLIALIELLFRSWYISRHDEQQLLADVTGIAADKEAERKASSSNANSQ